MKYPETIEEVKALDDIQKLSIYMHYYTTMLTIKYDFHFVDMSIPSSLDNWGTPDKKTPSIAYFYSHRKRSIYSFEEFISDKNIVVIDNGDNWKENGRAEKVRTDYFGIYDWYWKFKDEINLI